MTSDLLQMQAPQGVPRSTVFEVVTDPLLPPTTTTEMLAHFSDIVFDKRPESHLSRLMKVVLGDTGTGQLRKRYTYAHLSTYLLTTRYGDLDRLYADVFGLKRLFGEQIGFDVYSEAATDAEWEAIDAADASYRSRVEAFCRAIGWAGTPTGMMLAAFAVLGVECRVYETYEFLDNADVYSGDTVAKTYTYSDQEAFTYGQLNGRTYSSLEGESVFQPRLPGGRGEFIVRPLRDITDEERYHLTKVLGRLKPAGALLTIDSRPASVDTPIPVTRAVATSSYWHVQRQVQAPALQADRYTRPSIDRPVEQPRPLGSQYQGEAWNYNADVVSVSSYSEDENGEVTQSVNYERWVTANGEVHDYLPGQGLEDSDEILLGRAVSDGVLASSPVVRVES